MRVLMLFGFMLLLLFSPLFAAQKLTTKELARSINLAGKQRMLTQKMTKEALLVNAGIDKAKNLARLKKSRALFDKTLKGLMHGDAELGLKPCANPHVQQMLHEVQKVWRPFDADIRKVIQGKATKETYAAIAKENLTVLQKMHRTVTEYVAQSKKSSSKRAQAINLSGKERMLTQRMAKDLLLIAQNIDAKKSREDLKRTSAEFEAILHGLQKGDKKLGLVATKLPAIQKDLTEAQTLWQKLKPTFDKAIKDPKVMRQTVSNLDRLLIVMNRAVGKYEKSVQREKQAMQLSALVNQFMQKKNREKHLINLAGKQRMLTQKMTKEALLVSLGIDTAKQRKLLEKTRALYDRTLKGFREGDTILGLDPARNPQIIAYLDKLQQAWKPFSAHVEEVAQKGVKAKKSLAYLIARNETLLQMSDHLVQLFKKHSTKKSFLEKARLNIVDIAGRQRMLTQKMTKEKLLVAAGIEPKKYTQKLHHTVNMFDSALKMLIEGDAAHAIPKPSNAKIKMQLAKVATLWEKLRPIYEKGNDKKALAVLIKGNPVLLKEMDKAVHLSEVATDY